MKPALLVDSTGLDPVTYAAFAEIARAAGFSLSILGIERWIDTPLDELQRALEKPSAIFFVITEELAARVHDSPIAAKFLDLLERVPAEKGRLLALMASSSSALEPMFRALGIDPSSLTEAERFMRHPFGWDPQLRPYDTTLLPRTAGDMPPASLGAWWTDPATGLHILAGNSEVLTFSSIRENFRICPTDPELIDLLHDQLARCLDAGAKSVARVPRKAGRSRKTAWMEILMYEQEAPRAPQERLIDWIRRARFDALWISISPNQYYSPIARLAAKTDAMHASIERFTKMLAHPVQILVSVHIANNYFKPQPQPARTARDLFGNEYPDIPAPLDEEFWRNEVIDPVHELARRWPGTIPLSGIIIDLEMYLRHITGVTEFSGVMIEDENFEAHEERAVQLGALIRAEFKKAIPNCIIGVYMATISLNWFYRGFLRGLCAADNPLELFTFAGRSHEDTLAERGIFVRHSSVLMLSKIRSEADFTLAENVLSQNSGLWINRLSRVDDFDPTRWHVLEQTPLDQRSRLAFMDHLGDLGA